MEGRQPPPKAEHPFPDRVELWKKWGTPGSKAFWRSGTIGYLAFSAFMVVWLTLRDPDRGPFGFTLRTREEAKVKEELSKVSWSFKFFPNLAAKTNLDDPIGAILFDDGRTFVPPAQNEMIKTATSH